MNLNKKLRNAQGKEYKKSYPTQEEIDALPKKTIKSPDGKNSFDIPDDSKAPRETMGNVIANALVNYQPETRQETILVNVTMQLLWDAEDKDIKFKEKIKAFIIKVLYDQTVKEVSAGDEKNPEKKIEKGSYYAWVTSQVLLELGEKAE